ncbi:MAG: L-glutamate gamma-semialdehyde dehydrogenase [Ignavibacteriaceae bacterium]|nr:L-glutamate gamma-semialdehyde dehydrogenase [Ignavibacteriaceae bacterium]
MTVIPFVNEPVLDFKIQANADKQKAALAEVRKNLGKSYPLVIGGKEVVTEQTFKSYNPSDKDEVIAVFSKGTTSLAKDAIETAAKAFESWKFVPAEERATVLFRAAEIARRRRFEINAYMILEAGKNYTEADADTAEAIDFLEFYARELLRYAGEQPVTPLPGEANQLVYIPLGVGVVVPPWNFPFAILVGMSSAAIVCGNTVVLKPSSETPMMGRLYFEIMKEAGVPDGVLNFLPGSGGEVGDTLVAHPKTRFISFTGSMQVGIHINELAAKVHPGQIWLKRVVAEMGGKDSMVIDHECNVDEAAEAVVAAAFGFQGQKCSACSRAIVDAKVYDAFVEKVKVLVDKIQVGPAEENYQMGPVISKGAEASILGYIETGKKEGRLISGGVKADGNGYYIRPTVFADIDPMAVISQEEIFGPVLAIIKSPDFEESLKIANNTIYGLTGAVYSLNREKIALAKKHLLIGNLYFNRKCTGAMVGGHPFGGFNMSGTDSKAGGRDYLLLFLQAKLMSEKLK